MTAFTDLFLGTSPNDLTGTTLRAGGAILNANFALAANKTEVNNFTANQSLNKATMENWAATFTAFEVGGQFTFTGTTSKSAGGAGYVMYNAYFDGDWKYINSDEATLYQQAGGVHTFYTAVSGAAEAVITLIKALDILNDGGISTPQMKTGITQVAAGAAAGELWSDTDDDNTVKLGV